MSQNCPKLINQIIFFHRSYQSLEQRPFEEMEPKGKSVLTTKVTTFQSEFKEAPMEEEDPNEPGEKLNDSVNSKLASEADFKEKLANIKSVSSSQDNEISKGTGPNILFARYYKLLD